MIDVFLIIILIMLGCIGLGILIGWFLWGNDVKYYKDLYERKLTLDSLHSPEMKKKIIKKILDFLKSKKDKDKKNSKKYGRYSRNN